MAAYVSSSWVEYMLPSKFIKFDTNGPRCLFKKILGEFFFINSQMISAGVAVAQRVQQVG